MVLRDKCLYIEWGFSQISRYSASAVGFSRKLRSYAWTPRHLWNMLTVCCVLLIKAEHSQKFHKDIVQMIIVPFWGASFVW